MRKTYAFMLCTVHWKPPDDVQRNCLKHAEFYSKNKFEKLVHLVGFIIISNNYNITIFLVKLKFAYVAKK